MGLSIISQNDQQKTALTLWQQAFERSIAYHRLRSGADEKYWEQFSESYFRNRTSGTYYWEVVSFIGVPMFLYLMMIRQNSYWT